MNATQLADAQEAHERQPVADLVLGLVIGQVVERAQHERFEHNDDVLGLPPRTRLPRPGRFAPDRHRQRTELIPRNKRNNLEQRIVLRIKARVAVRKIETPICPMRTRSPTADRITTHRGERRFFEVPLGLPGTAASSARPAKASPLYPVLKEKGAEFGVVNDWERTSFYKPNPNFVETHGYAFQNWHEVVGAEIKALTGNVGLAEMSGFNHYRISGQGALDWLIGLTCSPESKKEGKASLCYFLTGKGNVSGEATIVPLPNGEIFYGSAAAAEYHDMDWLTEHLPDGSGIRIESNTNTHTMLVIAGPKTRNLLAAVSPRTKWGQTDFPWLTAQRCFIGHIEALAIAISFSGEQAFELHIPNTQLYAAYEILTQAGNAFGLSHFGMYAIESMRMEKGYGHWRGDFITEFNPIEAALDRFVDMDKAFPGKTGLQMQIAAGNRKKRVMLELDSLAAPAQPGEGVFADGKPVGAVTSAAWGHRTQKNLAMAYVVPDQAEDGTELSVFLLGKRVMATVHASCPYDPGNTIQKGQDGDSSSVA